MRTLLEILTRDDLLTAIRDFDAGVPHAFAASTGYDLVFEGRRYPPKAIVGLAVERRLGHRLLPNDFRGGRGTKCFQVLERSGFTVVEKGTSISYPDEIEAGEFLEGAGKLVTVNRYERDPKARAACIAYHGAVCQVCDLIFVDRYGDIGAGFIHVHHLVPLSEIHAAYEVDPVEDLRPVCPNCHAMLHKRTPPFTIAELRARVRARGRGSR